MPARPQLCVGAVIVHDGDLLLIRRGRPPGAGQWSLPGGRVERGETLAEAVEREVAEETGLTCRCGELVGWVERIDRRPGGHHFVILDFRATVTAHHPPLAGDDADEAVWAPLATVTQRHLVDGLGTFLVEQGIVDPPP